MGVSLIVPLTASLPVHEPLAVQEVALVEDQVRVADLPSTMEAGAAAIMTVGAAAAVTVTLTGDEVEPVLAASPL